MKENLRRPVLFATIVIVGSILILFDVPLIILIPLIIAVGFIILLILGAVTFAEIKSAIIALKPQNLKNTGILKRLDQMKFFEKSPAVSPSKPVQKQENTDTGKKSERSGLGSRLKGLLTARNVEKEKKGPSKEPENKPGMISHVGTLFASIGSFGSAIRQRNKQVKKVDDINKLLDKTVSEKVHAPPPVAPSAGVSPAKPSPPTSGGGGGLPETGSDADPFLSLSGDEFDAGLLDGLGDDDLAAFSSSEAGAPDAGTPTLPEVATSPVETPELPPPTPDLGAMAGDILKESGEGLEEFSGLDSGESPESDFGDLDSISLDDLDGDLGEEGPAPVPENPPAAVAPAPAAPAAPSDSNAVKTAWIPSDAPKNADQAEDQISTHADMAAFASGASADEDLLSSLASDVKHVKKDKDLSLLRELKDFRAPAGELEDELSGMYERMMSDKLAKRRTPPQVAKGPKER